MGTGDCTDGSFTMYSRERDCVAPDVIFPIYAAILRGIDGYRRVLESYSEPLRPVIEWPDVATI